MFTLFLGLFYSFIYFGFTRLNAIFILDKDGVFLLNPKKSSYDLFPTPSYSLLYSIMQEAYESSV